MLLAVVGPTRVCLLDFFCSGIQFYVLFYLLLYLDLYFLEDDAWIK